MKYLILLFSLLFCGQLSAQDQITWYTWDEGMIKAKEEHKKFIIDLYTSWCKWCKEMDKQTFSDPVIIDYINENFIAIKFNGQQKNELLYMGKAYNFVKGKNGGHHTLAIELSVSNKRQGLSYPSIIFLDEDQKVIQAIAGFIDPITFDPIMRYFAQDLYKSTPWKVYLSHYNTETNSKSLGNRNTRLVKGN